MVYLSVEIMKISIGPGDRKGRSGSHENRTASPCCMEKNDVEHALFAARRMAVILRLENFSVWCHWSRTVSRKAIRFDAVEDVAGDFDIVILDITLVSPSLKKKKTK